MAQAYSGSATISTTEISLLTGTSSRTESTTEAIVSVFLDLDALADGDEFELRVYEKVRSGDTKRLVQAFPLTDSQAHAPVSGSYALHLMHGWEMTLIKIAGTDRAIAWSIRTVAVP